MFATVCCSVRPVFKAKTVCLTIATVWSSSRPVFKAKDCLVDHSNSVPSDGSLDSAGWPEGGDWLGSEPQRDQVDKMTTEPPFFATEFLSELLAVFFYICMHGRT